MAVSLGIIEAVLRLKDEMTQKLVDSESQLNKFGGAAMKVGAGLTASLSLPIAAVGAASIKMAMDAVESENLFQVSFGGMADAARDWSVTMNKELGLNQYELRRTSATMFTMFDSMQIGKDASFEMATGITKLSHDMASFYNLKGEEAFEKLRAGIVGEAEPLKRLGILVDENTVKQAAMRNGLIKQGEEMSAQQKVLARYISIMEQTQKAQGDLARTIDSPTNQIRIMKERFNELSIQLGTAMLPAFTSLLNAVTKLMPYIESAVDWFTQLSPAGQLAIMGVAGLVAAIGPLLVAVGAMASGVTALLPLLPALGTAFAVLTGPIGLTVAAIAALTAAWMMWGDDVVRISREVYEGVKSWFVDRFNSIVNGISDKIDKVKGFFSDLKDTLVGHSTVPDMVKMIQAEFKNMGGGMTKETEAATKKTAEAFKKLKEELQSLEMSNVAIGWGQTQSGLQQLGGKVLEVATEAWPVLTAKMKETAAMLGNVEKATYNVYFGFLEAGKAFEGFGKIVQLESAETVAAMGFVGPTMDMVSGKTESFGKKLMGFFSNTSKGFGELQESVTKKITGLFGGGGIMESVVGTGMSAIFGPAGGMVSKLMAQGMEAMGKLAWEGLKKIGGYFKDLFGGPSAKELAGREVVANFEKNIASMMTEQQKLEAGNESWKQTVVVVRDAYLALGKTEAEALAAVEAVWRSSKGGADAAREAIANVDRVLKGIESNTVNSTRVMADAWASVEEAIDHVTYGHSPTGMVGYQAKIKDVQDDTIGACKVLEREWVKVEEAIDWVTHSVTATDGLAGGIEFVTATMGWAKDDMTASWNQVGAALQGVLDKMGEFKGGLGIPSITDGGDAPKWMFHTPEGKKEFIGTEAEMYAERARLASQFGVPVSFESAGTGKRTDPFAGFPQIPSLSNGLLISEADAIKRLQEVAMKYGGRTLNSGEIAALGKKYGYGGQGSVLKGRFDDFLKAVVTEYFNQHYAGYATGTHGQYVDFGAGTPVMLHGRERVMTEGEGDGDDMYWQELQSIRRLLEDMPFLMSNSMKSASQRRVAPRR